MLHVLVARASPQPGAAPSGRPARPHAGHRRSARAAGAAQRILPPGEAWFGKAAPGACLTDLHRRWPELSCARVLPSRLTLRTDRRREPEDILAAIRGDPHRSGRPARQAQHWFCVRMQRPASLSSAASTILCPAKRPNQPWRRHATGWGGTPSWFSPTAWGPLAWHAISLAAGRARPQPASHIAARR